MRVEKWVAEWITQNHYLLRKALGTRSTFSNQLGAGQMGVVIEIDDARVMKVTTDEAEARMADFVMELRGKHGDDYLSGIVFMEGLYYGGKTPVWWDRYGDEEKDEDDVSDVWVIVREPIDPDQFRMPEIVKAVLGGDEDPEVNLPAIKYTHTSLVSAGYDLNTEIQRMASVRFEEDRETCESMLDDASRVYIDVLMELRHHCPRICNDVVDTLMDLWVDHGVALRDMGAGNMGYSIIDWPARPAGQMVIHDMGWTPIDRDISKMPSLRRNPLYPCVQP